MKICVPVLENNGLTSRMSPHFGRAQFFAMVDDDTTDVSFVPNTGQHHGGGMTPAEIIGAQNVDVVLCGGLGVKAVRLFEQQGVRVYQDASGTVEEALKAYKDDKLPEATDANACQQHRH